MELDVLVTEGLGDNSYVLTWGDEGAVVDPQRDVDRFVRSAAARGATIRYVFETHVHNDYVSGAVEIRSRTGAAIWGPAQAGYAFGFSPVEDGTEIPLGDATLVGLATPGHTPEHMSYLWKDEAGEPLSVFSGGSLMVGSVGRTDLLGDERTEELTRLQFRSMRRLAELPDRIVLLPTHGAGSFCAAGAPQEQRTSTIAEQRATNDAFTEADEASFSRRQTTGLPAYPAYYRWMAPINRAGAPVIEDAPLRAMSPDDVAKALADGASLVDARDGVAFAARHVPRSLNIPLEPSFAAYVGWLVPFGTPLVLLVDDTDLSEALSQLRRIGWDDVQGQLRGGIDAWADEGHDTASYASLDVERLVEEMGDGVVGEILDVRQRSEWDAGHLDPSHHLFVGDLSDHLAGFDRSVQQTIVCASGYRASMAASLLDRAAVPVRLVAGSGVPRALRLLASPR